MNNDVELPIGYRDGARLLGVAERTFRNWRSRFDELGIPYHKLTDDPKSPIRFLRSELVAWFNSRGRNTAMVQRPPNQAWGTG